ncbi:hypothetical protein HMPREF1869_01316 [Bacteroidales bacterium KA00251]|nr:hypothetical protein HMPREF1869_01316 [Bacteroidales bacterium KA00251]
MWQRIQTLWLLLAGVTMTLLLLVPLAMSSQGVKFTAIGFTSPNLETNYITWGLFALDALVAFLCFFTIFLFKKRKLQMRLCIFTALLIIGYIIYYVVLLLDYGKGILPMQAEDKITPSIWLVLPLVALLFLYLSFKGIRRDEIKVRLMNRLR